MYVAFVVWTLFGVGLWRAPGAALVLATLGIIVYFGLIRSTKEGADAGPDSGTFGLALLLGYSRSGFGANFMSLPENIVGGTFDVFGNGTRPRACWPAGRLAGDARLHSLTRTARLEDAGDRRGSHRGAADGIRPDTMQAIAWATAVPPELPAR
jgi:branched-chain amino acid transport system permease protein